MLDKETAIKIATEYANEVKKVLNPKAIILYGSCVNGVPHEYSDIDIAVVFNNFQGNWMETSALLYKLTRHISLDIEPRMMDEASDRSGFLAHISKTGEVVYAA